MAIGLSRERWDVDTGELEFCFLIGGGVGGGREEGEGVEKILFVVLIDEGREGGEGGKQVVGY